MFLDESVNKWLGRHPPFSNMGNDGDGDEFLPWEMSEDEEDLFAPDMTEEEIAEQDDAIRRINHPEDDDVY